MLQSPADTLVQGRAYWLKTLLTGQSATLAGIEADTAQRTMIPLDPSSAGRWNMVGHPFDLAVDWSSVRILHDGQLLTLDQADPLIGSDRACSTSPPDSGCVMSRVAYTWSGAAYASFNGLSPGAEGRLDPAMGFWVRAFQPSTLLIQALPASSTEAAPGTGRLDDGEWAVRLTVESGSLADRANLLGQLRAARRDYDQYDLEELQPFSDDYLTIVFPHPTWGDHAGDYTADFHPAAPRLRADGWRFEVRSGVPGRTVTLRWSGPPDILRRSRLWDLGEPGTLPRPAPTAAAIKPDGTYTVAVERAPPPVLLGGQEPRYALSLHGPHDGALTRSTCHPRERGLPHNRPGCLVTCRPKPGHRAAAGSRDGCPCNAGPR